MRTFTAIGERSARTQVRQLVAGLIALPLTAVPFIGYANLTPEGRLVRDRAIVALSPPTLPKLTAQQEEAAVAAAPRYEGSVIALAYHGIGSASDAEGTFVLSAKRFAEHLATLKAAGMNTVTAAQVAAAFKGGPPLPPNAVMISFDDGRSDAMMFADPLLEQAGMSATMFVIADAASKPGLYYASWDKIEKYAKTGRWDIESHTASSHHEQKAAGGGSLPALTSRAPGESLERYQARVHEDLTRASAIIEDHVGYRPVAFAYPFGAYGADRTNDPAIADVLRAEVARHYALAFEQDDQATVPLFTADQDPLRLRRVQVQNWSGTELLNRIERARMSPAVPDGAGVVAPGQASSPPGVAGADPSTTSPSTTATTAPTTTGPTTTTGRAGSAGSPVTGITLPKVPDITLPSVTAPPVTVTLPPVTVTVPPVTVPPVTTPTVPIVTPPPTTSPPTTAPPTTVPPTTPPPTTVCVPVGKSGRCK